MTYRERWLPPSRPTLLLDGEAYDVDLFGMDDGRSEAPSAALRFLFQLGAGYMIHLYVIQAGWRGEPAGFFHTTWLKDCVVAHVEMEETGAPSTVEIAPTVLPLVYRAVVLGAHRHRLVRQVFQADGTELEMRFDLEAGSVLRWTRARRWELDGRVLHDGPRFEDEHPDAHG